MHGYVREEDVVVRRVGSIQDYRDKVELSKDAAKGVAGASVRRRVVLGSVREAVGRPRALTMREALGLVS
jgi:hypothetical protein